MILLDTIVMSEMWKKKPDLSVMAWLDGQVIETLYLSVMTVAELRYGIASMTDGKRRAIYQARLEDQVLPVFADRLLPFDNDAAKTYASLMAEARAKGRAMSKEVGYIAATASAHRLMVATRDGRAFEAMGLQVINPWERALCLLPNTGDVDVDVA